jgi:hypothetical protein
MSKVEDGWERVAEYLLTVYEGLGWIPCTKGKKRAEDIQETNRYIRKYSTSLIREM